jgi:hypothetical protein
VGLNIKDLSDEKLAAAFHEIREEMAGRQTAADHAENAKHVGQCFVNRNCDSCPEKRSDYWNIYSYVIGVSEGTGVDVLQFQTDKFGSMQIQKNHSYVHLLGKKIPRVAFDKAAVKFVSNAAEALMQSVEVG